MTSQTPWSSSLHVVMILLFGTFASDHVSGIIYDPFNPSTVQITEGTSYVTRLDSIVRCDPSDSEGVCVCLVQSSTMPFESWWLDNDAGYFVYFDKTDTLVAGTSYSVVVECRENNTAETEETQTLTVEVQPNQPPSIINYKKDSISVNAKRKKQYDVVYTVQYSDPEDDALTFSLTSDPDLNHFIIGSGDGKIRAATDMRSSPVDTYTLTVSATDQYNVINDFEVVVTMTNRNSAPDIKNLPETVRPDETAKAGDVLFDLDIVDPDQYIDLNPVCSTRDPKDEQKFVFDMKNWQIRVAYDDALDYEDEPIILIDCHVSDGYLTNDQSDVLTVAIKDINEPPKWSSDYYYCNIDEGKAGGPSCSLNSRVFDPEGQTFNVKVTTKNKENYFSYDPVSDLFTFAVDYDLDESGYPFDVTAIMIATDSQGATSRATVKVDVNDINDNTCQTDPVKLYSITDLDEIKRLGEFMKKDIDATAPNNQIHFEVLSADPPSSTDHILVVRNGEIFYTNLFKRDQVGTTFRINIGCIDGGVPRRTATTQVAVSYIEQTTTTTTTEATTTTIITATDDNIWDLQEFQAAFGGLMALLAGLLLLGVAALVNYCCNGWPWKRFCHKHTGKSVPRKVGPHEHPTARPPLSESALADTPVNDRWDNYAWNIGQDTSSQLDSNYFHYH